MPTHPNSSKAIGDVRCLPLQASPGAEHVIMGLASGQHGVVTRAQLLRAGIAHDVVDRRLKAGWLRRLHRGVYLVGPLTVPKCCEMAAALACGSNAAVSRRSAAALWQVLQRAKGDQGVAVTVYRGRARSMPGIHVRNMHSVRLDEVTVHDAIPITTPARTLFDLASTVSARELESALAEAFALRIVQRSQIVSLLDRHARSAGAPRLRALLEDTAPLARTRSEAEERFLALTRKAGLPAPLTNVNVANHEVDFLWRAERLVVEVDGRAFHSSARRFESDRRRDAVLVAHGLRIMRVTWNQIVNEPEAVLVRLAQALVRTVEV